MPFKNGNKFNDLLRILTHVPKLVVSVPSFTDFI